MLTDSFEHRSVNGKHQILVLELLGRSLGAHLRNDASIGSCKSPRNMLVKEISRQVVLGLNHVHACGIVHRDLQPCNIVLALQPDLDISADSLRQSITDHSHVFRLQRIDRQPLGPSVPPYVVEPRPLKDGVSLETSPTQVRAVVVDFGAASSFDDLNDGEEAFPIAMRPPELVLGMPMLAPHSDIWALGCLIFEIVTSRKLFHVWSLTVPEEKDDEYLQSLTEILGPLPAAFLSRWKPVTAIIDEQGNLLPEVVEEGISEPLEDLVKEAKPIDMDNADEMLFLYFLRQMLRFEPSERALTERLLRHPWLAGEH